MLKTKAETMSGASSVAPSPSQSPSKVSPKKAQSSPKKSRNVRYYKELFTTEIPEVEDDSYDPDFEPPALPDPDLDYVGEIPEDEVKELEIEGAAALDVDDLRRRMREAKLE